MCCKLMLLVPTSRELGLQGYQAVGYFLGHCHGQNVAQLHNRSNSETNTKKRSSVTYGTGNSAMKQLVHMHCACACDGWFYIVSLCV